MSPPRCIRHGALALAAWLGPCGTALAGPGEMPSFGEPIAPSDGSVGVAIAPDGAGLPPGQGTAVDGQKIYAEKCAACHGAKLQGVKSTGGPALVGGRGTLTKAAPTKTVESYWPYATTLFDYVKRAMPFNAPGSLSDSQVYAVTSYILAEGKIIAASDTLNAKSLPKVRMPNAGGFIPDPRPAVGSR